MEEEQHSVRKKFKNSVEHFITLSCQYLYLKMLVRLYSCESKSITLTIRIRGEGYGARFYRLKVEKLTDGKINGLYSYYNIHLGLSSAS